MQMTNEQKQELAIELLHADTEDDVVKILSTAKLWGDNSLWRLLGDREGNFATIGNQQSKPEAALVEKIVNSVDARLMNKCMAADIDPQSDAAPKAIPDAVAEFFPGFGGSLQHWAAATRKQEAEHITLAATGSKRNPCLTLVDRGEGQTPKRLPSTFMSIDKKNKLRIPFVQGKFNMGGTGVLKFCGQERLQLIITRRNPALLSESEKQDSTAGDWSVTITRRERPTTEVGAVRNSIFTFLAPVGAEDAPREGGVLSFKAKNLPLMPKFNDPYVRQISYGSAIKLYNYDMKGFSSNILMKGGLLARLDALLPEIALPLNLHECRDFKGKKESSFVTPLSGLRVRLEEGKGGNLEVGFPDACPFQVRGEKMVAKIYAFKDGRADTYRQNEGVIFAVNGQTHGSLPKNIFSRKKVKMGRLASSLLVTVDCTNISVDAREDLFMNSRDRLSSHQLRKETEAILEDIIAKHPRLKELSNERKAADISERLADSKPLEDVLKSIFKSSPNLSALFLTGQRLSNPHNTQSGGRKNTSQQGTGPGTDGGTGPGPKPFAGRPHPTYFRFDKLKDGEQKSRDCEFGRRSRLVLETDVENEYFKRPDNPGSYDVEVIDGTIDISDVSHSLTLHDGRANWTISLPEEVVIGESVTIQLTISDPVNPDGIVNIAKLTVLPKIDHKGKGGNRKPNTSGGSGNAPSGISMPEVIKISQKDWPSQKFDERSTLRIVQEADEGATYTFYINVDNVSLLHEMKYGKEEADLILAKFIYGNVLIGLALIRDDLDRTKKIDSSEEDVANSSDSDMIENQVLRTTRALAPFIIPMINHLGSLTSEDIAAGGQSGDDE